MLRQLPARARLLRAAQAARLRRGRGVGGEGREGTARPRPGVSTHPERRRPAAPSRRCAMGQTRPAAACCVAEPFGDLALAIKARADSFSHARSFWPEAALEPPRVATHSHPQPHRDRPRGCRRASGARWAAWCARAMRLCETQVDSQEGRHRRRQKWLWICVYASDALTR